MATTIESSRAPGGRESNQRGTGWLGPAVEPASRDETAQAQFERHLDEGVTMREPGDPPRTLWVNASHEQMNEAITQDANPATVAETSQVWVAVGSDLGTHQKTLGDAINASTSNWQGDAGDAVREHLAGVGKWLGATAQGATLAGRQQEIHSQALDETQRQMVANPPVQFDLQSTNRRLMSMTDPVQYAAAAGVAMQTYRAQEAAHEHAAQIMTQYDELIGNAVATPIFPAPPKLPSVVAGAAQGGGAGETGGARPLTAWSTGESSTGESPAAFDGLGAGAGVSSGTRPLAAWSTSGSSAGESAAAFDGRSGGSGTTGTTGTPGAGAGSGLTAGGTLAANDGGSALSTFDSRSGAGFRGGGLSTAAGGTGAGKPRGGGLRGGSGVDGAGFSGSGVPGVPDDSGVGGTGFSEAAHADRGGSGVGPSGFSGSGIPGTGTPPSFDAPDLPRGGSFSGAGMGPGFDGSTTSSGLTSPGIDASGGAGGVGFAPMPLSIPDTAGTGGVRGGSPLTGGGLSTPAIDPITGLPVAAGGTGTGGTKLPSIGRGGGINGESIGSRLGGPGGGGGPLGGIGGGGAVSPGGGGPAETGAAGGSSARGAGNLSGGAAAEAEAVAARGATSGRGGAGAAGSPGMGAMGSGTRKEDDKEHKAASFLENLDLEFFAGEQVVAPPVIGDWTNEDWK